MTTDFTRDQKAGMRELIGKLQEATEGRRIEPFSQAESTVMYLLVVLANQKPSIILPLLEEINGSDHAIDEFLKATKRLRSDIEEHLDDEW
jgi:hypothetical protein